MRFGKMFRRLTVVVLLCGILVTGPACSPPGSFNSGDFLGLEDWERDVLFGAIGLAGALAPRAPGLFSVFIDEFGGRDSALFPFGQGGAISFVDPVLGRAPLDPDNNVAFRVSVPSSYLGINPICVRFFLLRTGGAVAGNLVYTITVRQFDNGDTVPTTYVAAATVTVDAAAAAGEFKDIVLPLNAAVAAGLGGGALTAGDLLAFELESTASDGGEYQILGVEFYEAVLPPTVSGATIS